MYYVNYNDYELLYLAKEGNVYAYNQLNQKYYPLIIKTIRSFKIKPHLYDDIIQDSKIKLLEAINKFKDSYGLSFYKYYLLILSRMMFLFYRCNYYGIKNSEVIVFNENCLGYSQKNETIESIMSLARMIKFKDDLTRKLFDECLIEGFSIMGFSQKYGQEYTKMRYKYNILLNEIKKILTNAK